MGPEETEPRCWRIGNAILDERAMELRVAGSPVDVERKSLEVLRYLVRHSGELVTKDQLMAAVWPGRIVTESSQAKAMGKLREALGDVAEATITTVHGYGYRLEAPVSEEPPAAPSGADPPARDAAGGRVRRRAWLAAAAAIAVLAALWAGMRMSGPRPPPSVAVLPFVNLAGPDADYFSDGIHDAVIAHLARVRDLKVTSRTSVMQFRNPGGDIRLIGERLGVANVLEGSVQREGSRVRVTAQLIRVASDDHLWAEVYERDISNVFEIQSELAQRVARAVQARLTEPERRRIERRPTSSAEAYDLYLRARVRLQGVLWGEADRQAAESLLERALELDPRFALAHAALAISHINTYWHAGDATVERRELARQALDAALAIDPELAEAHAALAQYHYHGFRDYPAAERALERALELQPSDAYVHTLLGYVHRRQGRWEAALASLRRALELSPLGELQLADLAEHLAYMRLFGPALAAVEAARLAYPERLQFRIQRGYLEYLGFGSMDAMHDALSHIHGDGGELAAWVARARLYATLYEGRIADARALLAAADAWIAIPGGSRYPRQLDEALFSRLVDVESRSAAAQARVARRLLEQEVRTRADDAQAVMNLGIAHAIAGDAAEARAAAQAALAMLPVEQDAVIGPIQLERYALLLLVLGDLDGSVSVLERLAPMPGGHLGIQFWSADPHWRALRAHPRFQALVARRPRGVP